jgi:Kelch motif
MPSSNYVASDLASWATKTHVFVAGGYDATYTAQSRVFSIDAENFDLNSGVTELVVIDNTPLIEARGDVAASVNLETGYAYVSGGYTHANDFCEPLASVERYSLEGDAWITVASLPTARADKVMVTLDGHTVSIGGERQIENICEIDTPSPGEMTILVDDVEVLNDDDSTWTILDNIPETRFRFAAVVFDNTIYTFGGQQDYDETCECLKTTDEVVTYVDIGSGNEGEGTTVGVGSGNEDEVDAEGGNQEQATDSKPDNAAAGTSDQPGASVTADKSRAMSFKGMLASVSVLVFSGLLCL